MEDYLTILLSILGSSVITALITTLGRRRADQASIADIMLENASNDIKQIREENADLRARLGEMEKKINCLRSDLEERESLIKITDHENNELRKKVEGLEKELCIKNKEIKDLEARTKELEMALDAFKRERQSNTDRPRDQRTPDAP